MSTAIRSAITGTTRLSASWKSLNKQLEKASYDAFSDVRIDFIQPPSIFPISCSFSSKIMYFLIFSDWVSFASLISIFRINIFSSASFSDSSFLSLGEYALFKTAINNSIIRFSIFPLKECFSDLGNNFRYSLNNLYNSKSL